MSNEELANKIHAPHEDADAILSRDGFNYWCGTSIQTDQYKRLDIFFYVMVNHQILTSYRRAAYDGWTIQWLPHSNVLKGPEDNKTRDLIQHKLNVATREWRKKRKEKNT